MKRLFTLFALLALTGLTRLAWAQSTMVVTKTDGTQLSIRVDEIMDVTFPDDNRLLVDLSYTEYWLHPGQWVKLLALCSTANGEGIPPQVEWISSDEAVATVDSEGRVTAVDDGVCQIIARGDGGQASMKLNVVSDRMIEIEVDNIANRSCTYTVSPVDPTLRYYYDYRIQSGDFSVDGLVQHGSEEQNLYHFALDWWDFCGGLYGVTWQEFMNEIGLVTGTHTEQLTELRPGEQYVVFAFAVHEDGSLASPVEVEKFITSEPTKSDITFEVTMNQVTSSGATFTVVPSNDDPYFVNVQRGSYVEWFIERDCLDEMVASLTEAITPSVYPEAYCQGTVTRSTDDFLASVRSDTDYYVIVFGFNEGQTSEVHLQKFHTNP